MLGLTWRFCRRSTTSMPAVSSPEVSTSAATVVRSKSSGFVAATRATASWSQIPSLPRICRCARKAWGSICRSSFPARENSRGSWSSSSKPSSTCDDVSRGTIVFVSGSRITVRAAAGSQKKLKSATGEALPVAWAVPPEITMPPTSSTIDGSRLKTRAMLVRGPRAMIVISRGCALRHSQMTFSDWCPPCSGTRGSSTPPRPSAPWML